MVRRNGLLYAILLFMDFALLLTVFAVSRRMAENGSGMIEMGLAGGLLALCTMFSSVASGHLSDRIGRRRMMFSGSVLHVLCPLLAIYGWYGLAYMSLGIGSGMLHPSIVALLTEGRTHGRARSAISRTLIFYCLSWNAGFMSGKLTGGWLYSLDVQWPFLVSLLIGIIITICVLRIRRPTADGTVNTPATVDDRHEHQDLAASFARLARISNVGGAVSMSMFVYLFPKLAVVMHVPPEHHGALVASTRLLVVTVYLIMHLSSFWHFRFSTALVSQLIAAGGLILIANAESVAALWLGLMAASQLTGYNFFASLYYSTAGSADSQRGASSGWHEASLALGFVLGSTLGGLVGHYGGVQTPYLFAAGIILFLAVVQTFFYTKQVRLRSSSVAV